MKKIEKLIGQSNVKARLNDVIAKIKSAEAAGEFFAIPPTKLGGLTGMGKTFFGEAVAEAVGWQFEEMPPQAGWTYYKELAMKTASIDESTGEAYAIPTILFIDEAHDQKTIQNQIKLITGSDIPKLYERNGTKFFSDPSKLWPIFASNERLDPAIERRCGAFNLELVPYSRAEKMALLSLYLEKEADKEALEYFESRVKPTAGEVKNLAIAANVENCKHITLDVAKRVVQKVGLFPLGIVRHDLQILQRIAQGNAGIEVLKAVSGDVKTSTTKGRLGWLGGLNLIEPKKSAYVLTKPGIAYLQRLAAMQKEQATA